MTSEESVANIYFSNINQEASFPLCLLWCILLLPTATRVHFLLRHHYSFLWSTFMCTVCLCQESSWWALVCFHSLFVCSASYTALLGLPAWPTELCFNLELSLCQIHEAKIPEQPVFHTRFQSSSICSTFIKTSFSALWLLELKPNCQSLVCILWFIESSHCHGCIWYEVSETITKMF